LKAIARIARARHARWISLTVCALACLAVLQAQRPWREYYPMEGPDSTAPVPADYQNPAELVLGRLMYPTAGRGCFGRGGGRGGGFGGGGDWTQGGMWTVDYPRGDRTFATAIRRLTRIDVRSVEQSVNPDDGDEIFYWPYLHAGMPTAWNFTGSMAARIREHLLRGGFLVCDSFFGTSEWEGFLHGIRQIFPDREIEEIPDDDPIFYTAYDLKKKGPVGNFRSLMRSGHAYRGDANIPGDGSVPHWRCIRDDKGRIVVMIDFNLDLGDSWQLADNPQYPQEYSYLGIRLGINYVVYTMTH